MSPRPLSTRLLCACAVTTLDGNSQHHARNHIPSPRQLPRRRFSKAFTADSSHASQPMSSDTVHICHSSGLPSPDRLAATYGDIVPLQDAETHTCPHQPVVHIPVHYHLHSSPYLGPNIHLPSSSNTADGRDMVPNHFPDSWSSSRLGNTEHLNFATASQALPHQASPACFRDQRLRTTARTQAIPMSWPNNNGSCFQAMHSPTPSIKSSTTAVQSPSGRDPTLAPELPLDDSDFIAMLQNPGGNQSVSYTPHEMTLAAQSLVNNDQTASNTSIDARVYDAAEAWDYIPSDYPVNTPNLVQPSAYLQLDSEFDLCGIDIRYASAQEDVYHRATIDPHLPELPASNDTQFEFLGGIQDFATDSLSPVAQYCKAGTLVDPGYTAKYPDPDDSKTPFSPTPDPTSASTTPSRQHGAKVAQRDTSTDALLMQLRQGGKSYKQIKEILRLEEAESTLRGRYRTLIKPKEARVRKPEWTCQAVRLLFDGVLHFSNSNPIALGTPQDFDANSIRQFTNKVPWKQVAEWMEDQGSYRYGNATVKKKYLAELKRRGAPI